MGNPESMSTSSEESIDEQPESTEVRPEGSVEVVSVESHEEMGADFGKMVHIVRFKAHENLERVRTLMDDAEAMSKDASPEEMRAAASKLQRSLETTRTEAEGALTELNKFFEQHPNK